MKPRSALPPQACSARRLATMLAMTLALSTFAPVSTAATATKSVQASDGHTGHKDRHRHSRKRAAREELPGAYADREDVRAFISAMAARNGFDEAALTAVFARVRRVPSVLRLIAPPAPTFRKSWDAYRARFLDPVRIHEGEGFWKRNAAALERARDNWGVPPEIVVAIIGVETVYGRVTGDFRVIDALSTLAFDHPPRASFFREELEQYLLFAREEGIDAFSVRGSYAGAVGLPQFMPGSIRRHATDFDGDGRIDLRTSPTDAIGSVARFLARHGWAAGEPTVFTATLDDPAKVAPLIAEGIEPRYTIDELAQWGIGSPDGIGPRTRLALIDLPNGDAPPSYVLGARNFYVITRYNRSSFYAMAVIELARALAAEMGGAEAPGTARRPAEDLQAGNTPVDR